ncbi:hypothetical protein QWY82_13630 [Simiduia curdlanivorans]|uniref:Flagellar protein FliT n=1 Tax=Simiduia curdlanivorans TaxID=1492769 RepID=A0ABV8V7E6_9GAMM|nr:hypothetical protein [Simiduia curdlanivorans]MDN3639841.1 hypothetical protein [Simiduia curdlanivorans]
MKGTIRHAIEASNQLIQALEAGELQTASSLVTIRDRLIREVPIAEATNILGTEVDRDYEALMLQLQELDTKIRLLANGLLLKSNPNKKAKTHTDVNKQKLNKGYRHP